MPQCIVVVLVQGEVRIVLERKEAKEKRIDRSG